MHINFSSFEEHLTRKDKRDLYCRPYTALLPSHSRTQTDPNIAFLTRRKQDQGYTTRLHNNSKKAYRSIRSASLYQSLFPHVSQERACKLQIINNACLKKVFLTKPKPYRKNNSVYDVNATLDKQMEGGFSRKENHLPKYHCKKLKVARGKARPSRTEGELNKEQLWGEGVSAVVGTKIL